MHHIFPCAIDFFFFFLFFFMDDGEYGRETSATQKFPRSAAVLAAMQDLRANLPTHWPIAAVP